MNGIILLWRVGAPVVHPASVAADNHARRVAAHKVLIEAFDNIVHELIHHVVDRDRSELRNGRWGPAPSLPARRSSVVVLLFSLVALM